MNYTGNAACNTHISLWVHQIRKQERNDKFGVRGGGSDDSVLVGAKVHLICATGRKNLPTPAEA